MEEGNGVAREEVSGRVSPREAAQLLGVGVNQIYKLVDQGRLKARKAGSRLAIDPSSLKQVQAGPPQEGAPRMVTTPPHQAKASVTMDDPFRALRNLPADHYIELWRLVQGQHRYLCTMTPEEFSLRAVARDFGGGVYLARAYSDGVEVNHHGFAIDGPSKHPEMKQQPAPDPNGSLVPLIQQVVGQIMSQQQNSPAILPVAAEAPSRKQWLEELILMKQIFAAPASPGPQIGIETISGALMKGIEMASMVAGMSQETPLWEKLATGLMPHLGEFLGKVAEKYVNPGSPPPSPSGSGPRERNPLPPGDSSPNGLSMILPLIKRAARENLDPGPYAELILAEIPEGKVEQLKSISAEDFQHFAAGLDPELSAYPGWVGELREALLQGESDVD